MTVPVTTSSAKEARLDLQVLQAQVPASQRNNITEDTVNELERLANDPDYGEEFLDTYRDHLNILSTNPKFTSTMYMAAVKFFSLMEAGNSITDAYIIVFPERYKRRTDRGQEKKDITGEASRYNGTALVNEIRKVATIPVQLIHRHLLHEAIIEQADLMRNAKSEMVRQKAGEVLLRELKPPEENTLNVKVEDKATGSVIEELAKAAKALAASQHGSVNAGVPLKEISGSRIQEKVVAVDDEVIEDIVEPDPEPEAVKEKVETPKPGEWKF